MRPWPTTFYTLAIYNYLLAALVVATDLATPRFRTLLVILGTAAWAVAGLLDHRRETTTDA